MNLKDKIKNDLKTSMKSGDKISRDVLRMLNSDIKNKEIELMRELNDDEVIKIIRSSIKKRKDSVEQYAKGNRADLARKEEMELKVVESYAPDQMTEKKIREIAKSVIKISGFSKPSDFGLAMREVMKITKGKADGKIASTIVREELNG